MAAKIPPQGQALVLPPLRDLIGQGKKTSGTRIVTGHQPGFWHAGIAFKAWLACRLAREWGAAQPSFFCVDHEPWGELKLNLPRTESLPREEHVLLQDERASVRVPSGELKPWPELLVGRGSASRLGEIWEDLRTSPESGPALVLAHLDYLSELSGSKSSLSLVSRLPEDPDYLRFLHRVLSEPIGYARAFNEALARVRARHKVRHPALPLPDLAEGETPFWFLDDEGKRHPLRQAPGAGRFVGGPQAPWSLPSDPLELKGRPLLPRAATLTQFLRLEKADLFIHGLGGAGYEEVNDFFWPGYDGRRLGDYAVASFTWIPGGDSALEESRLRGQCRRIRTNPEEFVGPGEPGWNLAEEKKNLARSQAGGREKHLRMRELNEALAVFLAGKAAELEAGLREAEKREGRGKREDPFIHAGPELVQAWERAFQSAKGGDLRS